jgi:hypothetical protein
MNNEVRNYASSKTTPLLPFFHETLMYRVFGDGSSCSNYSRMGPVLLFHLSFLMKKMEGVVRDLREKVVPL